MIRHFAILHEDKARNRTDAELRRDFLLFVDIDLADLHFALVILGNLVNNWTHRTAGTAPVGIEIDQHELIALQHFGFEIVFRELVFHGVTPSICMSVFRLEVFFRYRGFLQL